MKTKVMMAVVALWSMFAGCATQQERTERLAKTKQTVTEAVEKKQLRIDIRSMSTMRYGSRVVTSDFFIELRGDTLRSYLPYLGQAHRAPMSSPPEGLNFDVPIMKYKESHPKADFSRLDIDVRTLEDTYHYAIELFHTGEAMIQVHAQNRDPISFDGIFVEDFDRNKW